MTVGRRAILWLAALLALLVALGTPGAAPAKPRLKRIHGTLRFRGSLLMRRGEIFLVTKSVRIFARGNITVDGRIELSRGAGLTLDAGRRLVINAPIGPAPRGKREADAAAGSGCSEPPILERSETFGIDINAPVLGSPGTADASGDGCPGQSVLISATLGGVDINARVKAGNGGSGRGDAVTRQGGPGGCHGRSTVFTTAKGGHGGLGGSVTIQGHPGIAGGEVHGARNVFAGQGGFGGIASARAPDGGLNQSGGTIFVAPGAGGNGGTALLEYGSARRHFGHAGQGGEPGSAFLTAGNGGPPNCDGGGSEAKMANSGTPGEGSFPSPDPLRRGSVFVTGGNGYHGPATSGDGGNGGYVVIHGGTPVPGTHGFGAYLSSLEIDLAARGGLGANGCPSSAGGNGGHNGNFGTDTQSEHIFVQHHGSFDIRDSFNGGSGNDGNPVGKGWHPTVPAAAHGLVAQYSWLPGRDGKPCPLPRVSYSDHPFKDIQSWVAGGSTVDPAEPHDVFALGQTSGGTYKVVDFNTSLDGPNPAFGNGSGEIALPPPPNANGYRGVSRPASGVLGVWAPSGTTHLVYALFNDAGVAQGSTNVSTGTAIFSAPQVFNFRTGGGALFVVATDVDSVSHNPALGTFAVATSGAESAGPCPTPTIFPHTNPTLSGAAYDPAANRFYFAGLFNSFADTGFFSTDGTCANATTPVSLGANAGQTLPAVGVAGGGNAFVLGGIPAPNNDQKLALYKVSASGTAVPGFTTWTGPAGVQAFPNSVFLDEGDVVGVGDLGGQTLKTYLNAGTGALDPSYGSNPFLFMTSGSTFSVVQTAQEPVAGTFVIFSDDSGPQGGISVITG